METLDRRRERSALIVAKAQGRTDVVVVLDDHVPAENYWPCFQAVVEAF